MRKVINVLVCGMMLLTACNKGTPGIPPLPPNQDAPTLDFEFVSIASTVKFIPFGDTLANHTVNKGYEILLSDTNESILTACSGIVTSIKPDTLAAGASIIAVKFKRNSIYSFTYGGVTRVVTHVNDSLGAGSVIGKVSKSGIVDFQLIMDGNTVLCPQSFGSPGFNQAIQEAILKNNTFNPTDSVASPCMAGSLSE